MNKKFFKYFREYRWNNVFAMIKNNRRDPEKCTDRFDNKLVIITGATSGIGYLTAKKYASGGANLLCINRNPGKSKSLKEEIEKEYGVNCEYIIADLSRLDDIYNAGQQLAGIKDNIDVLIHNAGIYLTKRALTEDKLEKSFVIHYLSSFIINFLLVDKLKAQETARIIYVSSEAYRFAAWGLRLDDLNWEKRRYSGLKSYGSAKLAQLLSMKIFANCFQDTGARINAMHPGAVKTDTGKENGKVYRWFKKNFLDRSLRSADISAEALYYLGVSPEVHAANGEFFNLTTEEEPAPPALDMEVASDLWQLSLEISGLNNK